MSGDNTSLPYVRHGFGSVRPYLYGHLDLLDLVTEVFGATELERSESKHGYHVELQISDSIVVLEVADGDHFSTESRASVYIYVPDVDTAYQRALSKGATIEAAPADKPYGERNAGVRDSFGNIWWIGTLAQTGQLS